MATVKIANTRLDLIRCTTYLSKLHCAKRSMSYICCKGQISIVWRKCFRRRYIIDVHHSTVDSSALKALKKLGQSQAKENSCYCNGFLHNYRSEHWDSKAVRRLICIHYQIHWTKFGNRSIQQMWLLFRISLKYIWNKFITWCWILEICTEQPHLWMNLSFLWGRKENANFLNFCAPPYLPHSGLRAGNHAKSRVKEEVKHVNLLPTRISFLFPLSFLSCS